MTRPSSLYGNARYRISMIHHECHQEEEGDEAVFCEIPWGLEEEEWKWRLGNQEGIRACPYCGLSLPRSPVEMLRIIEGELRILISGLDGER